VYCILDTDSSIVFIKQSFKFSLIRYPAAVEITVILLNVARTGIEYSVLTKRAIQLKPASLNLVHHASSEGKSDAPEIEIG
jgi:hypothetical protein